MVTHVYVAVSGTRTAGPDDNLFEVLREIEAGRRQRPFSKGLNRPVTGGATVLWVKGPEGIYMIDSGDFDDRGILEQSLGTISADEKVDAHRAVQVVYASHFHPDHVGNHDLFPGAYWLASAQDRLPDLMLDPRTPSAYVGMHGAFAGHRSRGITPDRFTRYCSHEHARPRHLTTIDTPGHERVHKSFLMQDGEIVVTNLETGSEASTDRLLFTVDAICGREYLERYLDKDPARQRTAVYGTAIPTREHWFNDQATRERMDALAFQSVGKLAREAGRGGLMLFGHDGIPYAFPNP